MSNEYLDWLADNLLDPEEKEQSKDEKLTYKKPKQIQVVNNMYNKAGKPELLLYHDEVCPTCGRYSYNGDVCSLCKKDYDLEDKKETYGL